MVGEDGEQTRQAAEMYGAGWWGLDYEAALSDPQVAAVVITTTTRRHDEIAVAAAEAGKHILIGKPISRTLGGADAIIQATRDNGVTLLGIGAGPNPNDPVKRLLDQGVIGRPYAATSSWRARLPLRAPGVEEVG